MGCLWRLCRQCGRPGYNVGLLQYLYPDYSDANTTEVYAGVTYKQFGLKASYTISDDYFDIGNGDGTVYWDATANFELPAGFTLGLHYGYTAGAGNQVDYSDWKIGVTKELAGFNVGLAYVDTDIKAHLAASAMSASSCPSANPSDDLFPVALPPGP
jgi:uncharacterized protein (TIGR02001 family)